MPSTAGCVELGSVYIDTMTPPRPRDLSALRLWSGSLTARDLIREAEARGWVEVRRRGKGSHRVWAKTGAPRIVIPARPARPTVLRILAMLDEGSDPDDPHG